jgi:hypothetical protein
LQERSRSTQNYSPFQRVTDSVKLWPQANKNPFRWIER